MGLPVRPGNALARREASYSTISRRNPITAHPVELPPAEGAPRDLQPLNVSRCSHSQSCRLKEFPQYAECA
jgi:hypothetical protein